MWRPPKPGSVSTSSAEGVVKFGSPMRQLGFSFEETTALIGKFEQEGVNTDLVMGSMRIALGKLAKAGETDLPDALNKSVQAIANTDDAGVAAAKAIELFGARAGPTWPPPSARAASRSATWLTPCWTPKGRSKTPPKRRQRSAGT